MKARVWHGSSLECGSGNPNPHLYLPVPLPITRVGYPYPCFCLPLPLLPTDSSYEKYTASYEKLHFTPILPSIIPTSDPHCRGFLQSHWTTTSNQEAGCHTAKFSHNDQSDASASTQCQLPAVIPSSTPPNPVAAISPAGTTALAPILRPPGMTLSQHFFTIATRIDACAMQISGNTKFHLFMDMRAEFAWAVLQEHLDAWAPTIFLLILLVSALASYPYPDLTLVILVILVILAFPFTLYLSLQQSQYIWPDPFADEAYPCSVPPPD
ncbi:uncharacterized protein EDB93DRAFT_1250082 [Suillus bovinus]|uniref:uncharacterized protein n=1 Tax=Suillus bovinus TaxID=48563 RepID=UPI001B85FC7A|nr:uncharacterized protein EDB93DRAFT_1250082 [Suillus bovinus]KAG2148640.1 hypothetical protein EDB93DRAFT_1250082 [Suillus bovinus]